MNCTDPHSTLSSAIASVPGGQLVTLSVGCYDEGLLSVLDSTLASQLFTSWSFPETQEYIPILSTAFGDLFVWLNDLGVYFFEAQRGTFEFVDQEVHWVVHTFLNLPEVQSEVLHLELFETVLSRTGQLKYGQTLIHEPWELLGGGRTPNGFTVGSLAAYFAQLGTSVALMTNDAS